MSAEPGVELACASAGKNGKVRLTASPPDGVPFTDTIDISKRRDRDEFLDILCRRNPELPREVLSEQLERLAAGYPSDVSDVSDSGSGSSSQATRVVQLAEELELFRAPGAGDADGYAVIHWEDHDETRKITSRAFKRFVSHEFYRVHKSAPPAQALADGLNVIQGNALYEGEEHEVHVRLAEHDGAIYLDLGDDSWRVVKVTASGWSVVSNKGLPVRFIRRQGTLPLPEPVRGGSLDEFRSLANLENDENWILVVAFMVGALKPSGPYFILRVEGEHGSAKSTLCRMIRAIIDPSRPPLRLLPRSDRDLMIGATNARLAAFDNLSGLPEWASNALCSLSTGGGYATRALYEDDEEMLFDAMRPILVNGINNVGDRPDFLDRSVTVELPSIPEAKRRPVQEVWEDFERARPRILGGLLDALVVALRNYPSLSSRNYPRMADAAKWVVAAEPALGWASGHFIEVFSGNRVVADLLAIETSPIGPVLLGLIEEKGFWSGTPTKLVECLELRVEERARNARDWPGNARKMGRALRSIAPNLRAVGLELDLDAREPTRTRERTLHIRKGSWKTSETSETSDTGPEDPLKADPSGRSSDVSPSPPGDKRPTEAAADDPVEGGADVSDISDVSPATPLQGEREEEEVAEWSA